MMTLTRLRSSGLGLAGAALAGMLTLVAMTACNGGSNAQADSESTTAAAKTTPATLFTVPQDQMSHVQVVAATPRDWPNVLRLTGNVDYNQFATTPVISPVGGPVARILAQPGQMVQQGQTLLEISSPDYAQARDTYVKAKDALALADKTYKRDQDLLAHQAIATADLEAAESVRNQAAADLQAAEQSLRILGFNNPEQTPDTPNALIPVLAPITGQIVDRTVAPGQLLQAGASQCFTISDMKSVWVLANVYQSDVPNVHTGDAVEIDTPYTHKFSGHISFISPAMDPNTRTLQARIEVDNPSLELKKDMYVTALVHAGVAHNVISVPDSAVLRDDQNVPFVYVQSGAPNQFAMRTVSIGQSAGGFTQIQSGLQPGESLVANGSLFLQFGKSFQQ